jgi:outer membrane protein assembly factor BamB
MRRLLLSCAAAIGLLLIGTAVPVGGATLSPADWPQWQGSAQHLGANTATSLEPPLRVRCTADLGSVVSGQVVADGVVYLTTMDAKVHAVDAQSCATLWSYQSDGPGLYPPAFDAGLLYVLNAGGPTGTLQHVVALDAATGTFMWRQVLTTGRGTDGAAPAVSDGIVLVAGGDWKVHAFDANDGSLVWRSEVDDGAVSPAAIGGGLVYATTYNQATLYAFDLRTGTMHWSRTAGAGGYTNNPIVSGGLVFAGGLGGIVNALNALTGEPVWASSVPTEPVCTPALAAGLLYKADTGGVLYAFDVRTGKHRWTHESGGSTCPMVTATATSLYITAVNGGITVLDAQTGSHQSTVPAMGGGFVSSPAIGPDAMYVGASDGKLYALIGRPDPIGGR